MKRLFFLRLALISLTCFQLSCAAGGGDSKDSSDNNNDGVSREQGTCATIDPDDSVLAQLSADFTNYLSTSNKKSVNKDSISTIPVVFHVISKGSSYEDGEIPDSQVIAQIDHLNNAFAAGSNNLSTPFRFELVGINRVRKPEWFTMEPGSQSELDAKSALRSGDADTLNIYTVNIEGNVLGYTTLPVLYRLLSKYDGMVINFRTLPGGSFERYNTGNVVVHETGHWLGLLHTFSGECDGFFGDLVSDTAKEKIPGKGDACPVSRDSCPEVEGVDPVHNHMTYTIDSCRSEFTAGQIDFMKFNALIFRGISAF